MTVRNLLGYAETTANVDSTATSEGTAQVVVTLPAIVLINDISVLLECANCAFGVSVTGAVERVVLFDNGAPVVTLGQDIDWLGILSSRSGWTLPYVYRPGLGSHTWSVRTWLSAAGTFRTAGSTGGPSSDMPFALTAFGLGTNIAPGGGRPYIDPVRMLHTVHRRRRR